MQFVIGTLAHVTTGLVYTTPQSLFYSSLNNTILCGASLTYEDEAYLLVYQFHLFNWILRSLLMYDMIIIEKILFK